MRASNVLAQTALPRHLLKRQRKKIEELAELAAHDLAHQDTAEYLVGILDHYEPDPDLEPSLGACEPIRGHAAQVSWAAGNRDDREYQDEREPDPDETGVVAWDKVEAAKARWDAKHPPERPREQLPPGKIQICEANGTARWAEVDEHGNVTYLPGSESGVMYRVVDARDWGALS